MEEHGSFRPALHFSPHKGWLNDPNGLIYHDGLWHLYFQHYPHDTVWGPMHWGHAVSRDLMHWEELPIALYPAGELYRFWIYLPKRIVFVLPCLKGIKLAIG